MKPDKPHLLHKAFRQKRHWSNQRSITAWNQIQVVDHLNAWNPIVVTRFLGNYGIDFADDNSMLDLYGFIMMIHHVFILFIIINPTLNYNNCGSIIIHLNDAS
jgi:hypothetical protein